jgi:hypothetical protein
MDSWTLHRLLSDVSELTAMRMLTQTGQLKPQITLSRAHRIYGRAAVTKWIEQSKIKRIKRGGCIYLDRVQLETLSRVNDFENQ